MTDHQFSEKERTAVYRAIAARRDMRHFCGGSVDKETLSRLLQAAHQAPSVGMMQPWRFIRITDFSLRNQIHAIVEKERNQTARALGDREAEFRKLKVEGILDCAELIVTALADGREKHIFGRRTMPDMDLASLACAIQNMWLAARAENLGMGWVSLFDPDELGALLGFPQGARPVAIICLGPVKNFYSAPMLELTGWITPRPITEFVSENKWSQP